ncbi:MAG: NAD(+) diphosphatase [Desulfofustis sp.]|nr:NAD(+) diphosphatase [Desulfofustis sp.]
MKRDSLSTRGLARSSLLRSDERWISDTFCNGTSRIIPVHNQTVLCDSTQDSTAVYLAPKDFGAYSDLADSSVFLGFYDEIAYFAKDINTDQSASILSQKTHASFQKLRSVIPLLDSRDGELLTLAGFMSYWHARNQYCGKCGTKTKSSNAGHVRICRNESCKESYFPSMDPAVIVLVSSGERCLLGRKDEWRAGMYSTLAGFVEPGEKAEDAVVREIQEEVGIQVENVVYKNSQAWLFPGSLMLGFTAMAKEEKIILDTNELDDARWFTREEIKAKPHILPHKVSIAYQLITAWIDGSNEK